MPRKAEHGQYEAVWSLNDRERQGAPHEGLDYGPLRSLPSPGVCDGRCRLCQSEMDR